LISFDLLSRCVLKRQELNVNLDVMAGDLFGVSLGVNFPSSGVPGEAAYAIADKGPIYATAADLDPVVALQVPHDPLWAKMIFLS
jgi:hypothetical protein